MTLAIWFWLAMALWLIFGLWREKVIVTGTAQQPYIYRVGGHLLEFVLFVVIGWKVFGSPVT